jgi:hypothetical protein
MADLFYFRTILSALTRFDIRIVAVFCRAKRHKKVNGVLFSG